MDIEQVLNKIDDQEIVRLCRDLVRINTTNPPGDERTAAEYIAKHIQSYGFEINYVSHSKRRASLIARLPGRGSQPAVVFNGHTDVVPVGSEKWKHPPFDGVVEDGKIWGRGSADMKGGLAAMMVAASAIAKAKIPLNGDFILMATAGEEINMFGARAIAEMPGPKNWQALIISEPTYNRLGLAERGVFWIKITTHGKTAHGSTPELGKNAIEMMRILLNEIEKLKIPFTSHPILGNFSLSINTIQGGVQTNVVPDSCAITIDMRTLPGQSHPRIL
ncbi:MAG: M20 family metallopeptidase, partial [Anaerolineales bacterium]